MRPIYWSCLLLLLPLFGTSQTETTISQEDRLYGLAQLWHGTKVNFAFFEQVPHVDWDSLYRATIPKVIAAENDFAYARILQNMCAQLQDGHTRVYFPKHLGKKWTGVPLSTQLIEGKVYITEVLNDTLLEMGIKPGLEITHIDQMAVHDYAKEYVEPYCFASTPQDLVVQTYDHKLLRGFKGQSITLGLQERSGDTQTLTFDRGYIYERGWSPVMSLEMLEGNIAHLTVSRFWGDDFQPAVDSLMPLVKGANGIVIDIRSNSGGNSDNSAYLLSHFSSKSFRTSNWSTPTYNAAFASWEMEQEWHSAKGYRVKPKRGKAKFKGPVVTLIGPKTYSAAEDFCSYYRQADIGPMIGAKTAGSTGNPIGVQLLDQMWAQVCTKKDVFHDGTEFVGYGVSPDMEVVQSAEDFWKGRDTVLEEARQFLLK
ncbi:MAG: S41 family peptidase [Bacteroidota bacterium]